jgi:hypothetical protein
MVNSFPGAEVAAQYERLPQCNDSHVIQCSAIVQDNGKMEIASQAQTGPDVRCPR